MGGLDFTIYAKEDLEEAVQALGFLPLFANEIQDFSIEEHTVPKAWFSDFANFRRDGYDFDALYDDCALGVYQSICGFRPYIHKPY